VTCSARRTLTAAGGAGVSVELTSDPAGPWSHELGVLRGDPSVSSSRRRARDQALRRSTIMITSRPEIPNSTAVSWKWKPNLREGCQHARNQVVVDVAHTTLRDRAQIDPIPPMITMRG